MFRPNVQNFITFEFHKAGWNIISHRGVGGCKLRWCVTRGVCRLVLYAVNIGLLLL